MIKKIVSAILCTVLITGMLSSCGSSGLSSTETQPGTETQPFETTAADPHLDDLPDSVDLNGAVMTFLARYEEQAKTEIRVEAMNGEVINDAVFERNAAVMTRLNCEINVVDVVGVSDMAGVEKLEAAVAAGDSVYDLFCNNSYHAARTSMKGSLINLKTLEHLDLSKPYWARYFNDSVSVGGKQYIATGPMALGFYRYLMVQLFNKNLFTEYKIDYPYEAVSNGVWTLDKLNEIAQKLYNDINGDGSADAGDQYGFYTRANTDTSINDGFWGALNLRTAVKDEDDNYVLDIDLDHFSTSMDKLLALVNGTGTYKNADKDDNIYGSFAEGRVGVSNARLYIVEKDLLRNMSDEYGILPIPKSSDTQQSYYTMAQDQFLVYGIPVSADVSKWDDIGLFLEAYASESYLLVKPAYYETALTIKYANDAESVEMLDLITGNMYLDPAILYIGIFPISVNTLRTQLKNGQNTLASTVASSETSMTAKLAEINEAYAKLEY